MQVLTPIPLIMNQILVDIKGVYPDISYKFDPTMSYEETIRGLRAIRSSLPISNEQVFPLMTYSLGPISPTQIGRRNFPIRKDIPNLRADQFIARMSQFDLMWKFYYSDLINFTTWEVMWMADMAINKIKEVSVAMPVIGNFRYFIVWDKVEGITFNKQDNLYMEATGKATVTGEMIIGQDLPTPLINEINVWFKDFKQHSLVYDHMKITPSGVTFP